MDRLVSALVPGMPAASRDAITAQAQGIPLFAVETIRSLIDRDIVVRRDGVNRLVGSVGALTMPDSLHALLAARLDSLDAVLRSLVADAAVLGSSFPAEALVAASGREERVVRTGLAELLRREVFQVSADPLSPQRGSYRFAQNLLRQVAYQTLSRRDRKTRHLAVAAYLRTTFAGGGEEVIDAIAHHYREALEAVPGDPDNETIRDEAVAALVRAAQRARRAGAPAAAAGNYAVAARLQAESASGGAGAAGALWESAADAQHLADTGDLTISYAEMARDCYAAVGDQRGAARADSLAGRALRAVFRLAEAKDRLTSALAVLQQDPDESTAAALADLGAAQMFSGDSESAAVTTAEALRLGQSVGASDSGMCILLVAHALAVNEQARPVEAIALLEYAARLAERNSDSVGRGLALLNLCYVVSPWDLHSALDAARASVHHCRRVGGTRLLPTALGNLTDSLIWTGDWDGAAAIIAGDGWPGDIVGDLPKDARDTPSAALLAALRGDPSAAQEVKALQDRTPVDGAGQQAVLAGIVALIAETEGRPGDALAACRQAHQIGASLGPLAGFWGLTWPIAIRAAWILGDADASQEMLAKLDGLPPGRVPPLLRAERDIASARLLSAQQPEQAADLFAAGLRGLRAFGSPYHLALGLLDQAEYLVARGMTAEAGSPAAEAQSIASALGAAPLAARSDRVAGMVPMVTGLTESPAPQIRERVHTG
jgi:hypothetical protein